MSESRVDWITIRSEYESGVSLRQLAARYNVSKTYIIEKRNKEHWDRPEKPTTDRPMNSQKIINRDANAATRATLAVKLRAAKLTFEQIAERCGYKSPGACRNAIQRELQRVVVTNVEELRREELYILDALHGEAWSMAMDPKNSYRTFAMDRVLAISKRRSELMGLDMPVDVAANANLVVIREVVQGYLEEPAS